MNKLTGTHSLTYSHTPIVEIKVERKEELVSPVERLWRSSLTVGRVDWSRLDSET